MTDEDKITIAKALKKPSGYARIRLGIKLHPTQAAVLDSMFENNKVSFLAANGVGKTSSVITPAILYAIEMLNCNVISTSASHRQLLHQLMPNIKRFAHLYPNYEFLETQIKVNGKSKYLGFATNDGAARFQGFHSTLEEPLIIIVDEAAGVHEDIFQAISRCNPTYYFVCGSPLSPEGVFYSIENETNTYKLFKHFKLRQHECLKQDGWWLDINDINNFIQQWGNEHPLTKSSIYAEFSSNIENGLIALSDLNKCYEYPPKEVKGQKHIGLDFAAGGDNNCIVFRDGNKLNVIAAWRDDDTMRACDKFAIELNKLKEQYNIIPSMVSADADGMGIAFIHRLRDLGWSVNEFHGGASSVNSDQYANKISECWFELVKAIKNCSIILPDSNEFKLQILSRKQLFNDKGKLKLESKNDMKSRGISSPDIVDAAAMSFSNPSLGNLTMAHKINIEPRKYSFF